MRAKRLLISGTVQGVGYRAWMAREARSRGLSGWVRNRADGRVEALLYGEPDAVEELVRLCRRGPRAARVTQIDEVLADPPEAEGFTVAPTG